MSAHLLNYFNRSASSCFRNNKVELHIELCVVDDVLNDITVTVDFTCV